MSDSADVKHRYVAYSESLEHPSPDEDELIGKIVKALHRSNEWAFNRYKHGIRDAHAKSHAVLREELTVYAHLPEHLRQGLFATPATYPVIARLSSTYPAIRPDRIRGVRAIAIKVLGVHGPRALPGDDATTQDFVLVNHSEFPYADARAYYHQGMPAAWLLARLPDRALAAITELLAAGARVLRPFRVSPPPVLSLLAIPNAHILGQTYHSAAPLRYGQYVAKIRLAPLSMSVRQLQG
jgi:hypothetical protein